MSFPQQNDVNEYYPNKECYSPTFQNNKVLVNISGVNWSHVPFSLCLLAPCLSCNPHLKPQVAGAAILGVGIWVKVDSGSVLSLLEKIPGAPAQLNQVLNVGYLLIAVGAVLLLLGFLGCCGAVKESKCMLLMVSLWILLSKDRYGWYILFSKRLSVLHLCSRVERFNGEK